MIKKKNRALAIFMAVLLVAITSSNGSLAALGGPRDSVITLQSPLLDASNTWDAKGNQQMADSWVAKGWFGTGLVYQVSFAPVGSIINLTYNIKGKDGKPLAFTKVNLRINKGYSESGAIVEVDGVKTNGQDRPPFDQANVIHVTDAFGNVTFALKNLDLESSAEPEPENYTSKPIFSEDKLDRLHAQMLPEVNGEQGDHSVITEFHYYKPKTPINITANKPTIKLVTPALNDSNSILDSGRSLRQVYAPWGSDVVVVYKVTGDDGRALPNQVLTLKADRGKTTMQATSDAFGYAAFTVKSARGAPIASPKSPIPAVPSMSTAFSTLIPQIAGVTPALVEGVEIHYHRSVSTSVEKTGKTSTLSISVTGAVGKSVGVDVTGLKSSKVKINSAVQVIPLKVTTGTKTVTVTIDGKKYTSKVVVK
ncbi:MAG: hypothetical protein FJW47_02115 [Actinobacteria bacterium]|nr:hypothetical protein [Actinomycetota bacterium]